LTELGLSKINQINQKGAMLQKPAGVIDLFNAQAAGGLLGRATAPRSKLAGEAIVGVCI
jgi:hypothetical protein